MRLALLDGAGFTATTPAAEKVYRSLGAETRIATEVTFGETACCEWLPQATIRFDGARLARRLDTALAPGARLLAAEMLVLGRAARGEKFAAGLLHPLTGADHLAAMGAIGLRAGLLGGRLMWLLPLSLLGGMAAAGALGYALGFLVATALLHAAGAVAATRLADGACRLALRVAGGSGAAVAAGVALFR